MSIKILQDNKRYRRVFKYTLQRRQNIFRRRSKFHKKHIEDLRYKLDYEKRKYEMDLYNAGIVDVMDTY